MQKLHLRAHKPPPPSRIISNIKALVPIQLSNDNYPMWSSQIHKLFKSNVYSDYLDGSAAAPSKMLQTSNGIIQPNPAYNQWTLTDQNLAAAICSTISTSILPYVLQLESCYDIWATLTRRLQASNRSRVIQLKNELHNISMKNMTMTQYLQQIKSLVDNIDATGSQVDTEDIIIYTINGFPNSYQAFKTSIQTKLTPISLEDLYSLLISEEINISSEQAKEIPTTDLHHALLSYCGRAYMGRGRLSRNSVPNRPTNPTSTVNCQICGKLSHSAQHCWHRLNMNYSPQQKFKALATNSHPASSEWFLDSGASSHLINNIDNVIQPNVYQVYSPTKHHMPDR
ncbi:hypothetical protein M5K25_009983 [Dendrobium thyrsiflorum]|uniref:Retrovirus-related Pol polyprotein from transposon TNT 1-94 n=1 Tax=Dendrobium thyrsiflorum TaxID=117978 RepID=A0ABD0V874_DENTH